MSLTAAVLCVTLAIYHEARGEPERGQRAVAEVIINRVESPYWPSTPCEVVTAPAQFSFYWDDIPLAMYEKAAEKKAKKIAKEYILGDPKKVFEKPIKCFMREGWVTSWHDTYEIVEVIGSHKFIDC